MSTAIGIGISPIFSNVVGPGGEPPLAPTNLVAVVSGKNVALSWDDNATNETGYKIYRSFNGVSFFLYDTIGPDNTTYTDTSPLDILSYYYVAAYNDFGETNSNTASVDSRTYATRLVQDFAATEVWAMVNTLGSTVPARVQSVRNGSQVGLDLNNTPGPVPGSLAPRYDGISDRVNIYSSSVPNGLDNIFDGNVGSLFIFVKVTDNSVWSDGALRHILHLRSGVSNRFLVTKETTNNRIRFLRIGANVTKALNVDGIADLNWFSLAMSWNTVADQQIHYVNAVIQDLQTGLGTFTGSLSSGSCQIGSQNTSGTASWNGWLAYTAMKFGSVWTSTNILNMHNLAASGTARAD